MDSPSALRFLYVSVALRPHQLYRGQRSFFPWHQLHSYLIP